MTVSDISQWAAALTAKAAEGDLNALDQMRHLQLLMNMDDDETP